MEVHVFDWRWKDPQHAEVQAVRGGHFGRKVVTFGDAFSVSITDGATCCGFMNEKGHQACLSAYPESKPKCQLCRSQEGSFVYTVFDGFNTENLQEGDLAKIKGEHVVYLALFDENTIKIGVSKAERSQMRQIEQGSHATLYIAKAPDGIMARQIETLVRKSGLQDKVQASQKKKSLTGEISPEIVKNVLAKAAEKAKEVLKDNPVLFPLLHEVPELKLWDETYNIPKKPIHMMDLKEGEWVSGVVMGMKGAFVVLDCGEELVGVNMKSLRGKKADFAVKPFGVGTQAARQSMLF